MVLCCAPRWSATSIIYIQFFFYNNEQVEYHNFCRTSTTEVLACVYRSTFAPGEGLTFAITVLCKRALLSAARQLKAKIDTGTQQCRYLVSFAPYHS